MIIHHRIKIIIWIISPSPIIYSYINSTTTSYINCTNTCIFTTVKLISGIIDDMESKLLKEIFNVKYNELNKMVLIPSPCPNAAIKAIPWIADDQVVCDYLAVSTIISFYRKYGLQWV